jgi:hypothetical protein
MVSARRTKRRKPSVSPGTKRARFKIVHQLADKAAEHIQPRKEVYGQFEMMMDDARKVYPWVTDAQVKCRLKRLRSNKKGLVDVTNTDDDTTDTS